jgi:shikimate dehydrogenase
MVTASYGEQGASSLRNVGYPTGSFKAPMIYNPWFEAKGIDAVVTHLVSRLRTLP